MKNKMPYAMALLPGMFYMFIVTSYIMNAKIGFGLPLSAGYIAAAVLTSAYAAALVFFGKKKTELYSKQH